VELIIFFFEASAGSGIVTSAEAKEPSTSGALSGQATQHGQRQ